MVTAAPTHEQLVAIAAGVGAGILEETAAERMVDDLIWAGLTVDAVDKAKEMATADLGDETPQELEERRAVLERLGMPQSGLDLGDTLTRRRALDWLESLRPLFDRSVS